MKFLSTIVLILFTFLNTNAQDIKQLNYGQNIVKGKIILKNLKNPSTGSVSKNALVLKLIKKIRFKPTNENEADVITDEISIYGNLTDLPYVAPNIKYQHLINKLVTIYAIITYAATLNYPLPVNIAQGFTYEILK